MAVVKVLKEQATVKVGDKWLTLKAVLTTTAGGRRVIYVDNDGSEKHSEPLSRSQFKGYKGLTEE